MATDRLSAIFNAYSHHGHPVFDDATQAAPRVFSPTSRDKFAAKGVALPDGSYPIPDRGALARAVQSIGRAGPAGSPAYLAVKAHVIKRARALDAVADLPIDWKVT